MSFKTTVLSIDGGGIKGIVPAIILAEIERKTGQRIYELFDLIVGTSTGGILALGLTKPNKDNMGLPFEAKKLVEFYVTKGQEIFKRNEEKKLNTLQIMALKGVLNTFGIDREPEDLFSSKYTRKGKIKVISEWLEDVRIKSALTEVLITSYATNLRMPFFFTSNQEKEQLYKESAKNFRMVCEGFTMTQAAMATSAAPTYFKPYPISIPNHSEPNYTLVDGGIFANNPTSIAIIEAMKSYQMRSGNITLDEILVVSLGTGRKTRRLNVEDLENWGQIQWTEPLINMVFNGQSEVVDFQMEQLLTGNLSNKQAKQYYRFQLQYPEIKNASEIAKSLRGQDSSIIPVNDAMDDTSENNILNLAQTANRFIDIENKNLEQLCNQLIESMGTRK